MCKGAMSAKEAELSVYINSLVTALYVMLLYAVNYICPITTLARRHKITI